ncbi:hypothetical protein Tcan_08897, partial [Toxocara canis]
LSAGRKSSIGRQEAESHQMNTAAIGATQHETQVTTANLSQHLITRNSTKHVIRFSTVKGHDDISRAVIRFRNIGDLPLNFKLKCEQGCNIAAHPAGNGVVVPHSAHRCVLTWHRPREAVTWTSLKPPRLAIITNYFSGTDFTNGEKLTTKFIANIIDVEQEADEKPPTTKVTFDVGKNPVVTPYQLYAKREQSPSFNESLPEQSLNFEDLLYYHTIIEWIQLHPTEILVAVIVIFIGAASVLSELLDE